MGHRLLQLAHYVRSAELGILKEGDCIYSKCIAQHVATQWRKKIFLNRGAINKIARKARKIFFGSHDTPLNHAHYYANLAVK